MSKKFGWVIHYDDGDVDYEDFTDEPFDSYEDAYEDAEDKCSARGLGANMMHAYDPDENSETSEDISDGEIEVFEVD